MVSGLGALVAHLAFWILLVSGWAAGTLSQRAAIVFLILWMVGYFGLVAIPYVPFVSVVAVLDVVLILIVFKRDVRLR